MVLTNQITQTSGTDLSDGHLAHTRLQLSRVWTGVHLAGKLELLLPLDAVAGNLLPVGQEREREEELHDPFNGADSSVRSH